MSLPVRLAEVTIIGPPLRPEPGKAATAHTVMHLTQDEARDYMDSLQRKLHATIQGFTHDDNHFVWNYTYPTLFGTKEMLVTVLL